MRQFRHMTPLASPAQTLADHKMEQPMSRFEPGEFDARSTPVNTAPASLDQTGTQGANTPLDTGRAKGTAVIVSTRGRPDIVRSLVQQLGEQTMPPDHIFIIASKPDDVALLDQSQKNLTVRIGRPGSTFQRNDGLALAGSRFSTIVFFDDDFVPSRFWLERMTEIFKSRPDIAGLTGTVLADGTRTAGIKLDEAQAMVQLRDTNPSHGGTLLEHFAYGSNVGCNMAYRYSAIRDIAFDERLPLYAWHEDSDFRGQVERRGLFVRADELWGVHLGHKQGRHNGLTLGYSQIANAVYLARKGTVPARFLADIAGRNLVINALRSFRPEPFVDRRGRLRGNLIALADLVRGRVTPERILEL
jgi:glycosyltransferase involved in cell wall biosynthesis